MQQPTVKNRSERRGKNGLLNSPIQNISFFKNNLPQICVVLLIGHRVPKGDITLNISNTKESYGF